MSPLFIASHQHPQLFPLTKSRVFTKPTPTIVLALLVSMVLVPNSMLVESTTPTSVILSSTPINTCHYDDVHVDATLICGSKKFVVFCEFKIVAEMFVGAIEDDGEDL
jgi:hypothetical protein